MHLYIKILLVVVLIFLLAGVSLYLLEHKINPRCNDLFDAFWLTTVFFFSGFEEFGPVTTGGKIISFIEFIIGAGIMVVVTAKIASYFVRLDLKEVKMLKQINQHIAICNWNDGGDRIIKELHSHQAEPETEIVVITTGDVREEELRKSTAYQRVYFIKSDPSLHEVLESAQVHLAKSVIVLADETSPDPDATSALIALAINRLCKDGPKPHIVAEAINHRKIQHLEDAGVDEVVCATDYGLGVLAQCALHAKLSTVYHNLLTYAQETNEIYMVAGEKFPRAVLGKTFMEAAQILLTHRDAKNPAILIGVKRDNRTILNPMENWIGPKEHKFEKFQEGDALIVLSYEPPDLHHIVDGN